QQAWIYDYDGATNRLASVTHQADVVDDRVYTYDHSGNLLSDDHRPLYGTVIGRANLPWSLYTGAFEELHFQHNYLYSCNDQRIYKGETTIKANSNDPVEGLPLNVSEFYLHDAGGREIGVYDMRKGEWTWYMFGGQRF